MGVYECVFLKNPFHMKITIDTRESSTLERVNANIARKDCTGLVICNPDTGLYVRWSETALKIIRQMDRPHLAS